MAPPTGLEPVTSWLTVMRSTDWAMEEYIKVGISLFSRGVTTQVSSAPLSLTSVFGMGTGVPSTWSTPTVLTIYSFELPIFVKYPFLETFAANFLLSCCLPQALKSDIHNLNTRTAPPRSGSDSWGNRPSASRLLTRAWRTRRCSLKTIHRIVFLTLTPSRVRFLSKFFLWISSMRF